MPVDLREHDPNDPIDIRPGTNKAAITQLLYGETNLAYTPAEIRDALDLPRGTPSTTLSRLHDDGLIGKTSDGLYYGFDHRDDLRRFARSLVQLDELAARYPAPGLTPDDVEQTGGGAKAEIPPERLDDRDTTGAEPAADDWMTEAEMNSDAGQDADQDQ